jgi:hypothetical protein
MPASPARDDRGRRARSGLPAATAGRRRVVLLLLAAGMALLPLSPIAWHDRDGVGRALADAVHFPLFGLFTVLLLAGLAGSRRRVRLATAAIGGSATALVIEIVQPLVRREASLRDLTIGLTGVAAALGGAYLWERRAGTLLRSAYAILVAGLLLAFLQPAWTAWRAVLWRRDHFPRLAGFETDLELPLWRPQGGSETEPTRIGRSTERAREGGSALRIDAGPGWWAGAHYAAGRHDWRSCRALAFAVFEPHARGRPLWLRVDDSREWTGAESSFRRRLTLQPGWNEFRIPLTELAGGPAAGALDLGAITWIVWFNGERLPPRTIYLDDVRLTGCAPAD